MDSKIYIAGPMRGKPLFNFPAFEEAEDHLVKLGYDVVNPVNLDIDNRLVGIVRDDNGVILHVETLPGYSYDLVLDRDIEAVKTCDAIYLLPGWEWSDGAREEVAVALRYGLDVYFQ